MTIDTSTRADLTNCNDLEPVTQDVSSSTKDLKPINDLDDEPDSDLRIYPEGGTEAWSVVFGAFCAMIAVLGTMNTMGVFQAYISTHQLSHLEESQIAWIFSVYSFLAYFGGVQIGPYFDAHGPRLLLFVGSVLMVASTLLLGVCTEYWQFMVVFGIMGGVGTSLIFTPSVSSIGHFFKKGRGNATGIAAMGGGPGGVIFPLMLESLFSKVGFGWATRILGLIYVVLLAVANCLVHAGLPPRPMKRVLPDISIFKDRAFVLTVIGIFFEEWGLFIPISYLTSYALASGTMSDSFAYSLISIFNAGSIIGRWAPGYIADKIGRFNTMVLTVVLCGLSSLVLWLPSTIITEDGSRSGESTSDAAVLILTVSFALIFGFASGSNISLTPVCVGQLCATEDYGRYYATCYTIVSFGNLTGLPIAGVLLRACGGAYWGLVLFTGLSYCISGMAFSYVRVSKVGKGVTFFATAIRGISVPELLFVKVGRRIDPDDRSTASWALGLVESLYKSLPDDPEEIGEGRGPWYDDWRKRSEEKE